MQLLYGNDYEEAYDLELESLIQPGDVIWDVGANIGYYSRKFLQQTGPDGCVVAFEPSDRNFNELTSSIGCSSNFIAFNVGLGAENETTFFNQGLDPIGATSRISKDPTEDSVKVSIFTGDTMCSLHNLSYPNVLKIDVEGSELEVLKGIPIVLSSPSLYAIGVEVHFSILDQDGRSNVARLILEVLKNNSFICKFVDPSHLIATRNR
ncbi:S-adenosyl-L-methionine-dependent methyltransferase [Synechococcus sp. Minos11]|nr:S-adenosyl-L-methionine-dependent methyltransferase [Synechococcus sp. Minos11]